MDDSAAQDRSALSFSALAAWAWRETPPVHAHRTNLLLHIVAVPLFVIGHLWLLAGLFTSRWLLLAAIAAIAVSLRVQKYGHSLEHKPSIPFTGARDFLRRIYIEQFYNLLALPLLRPLASRATRVARAVMRPRSKPRAGRA